VKEIISKSRKKKQPLTNEEIEKVRMEFFNFFVNIFRDYNKFIMTLTKEGKLPKPADGVQACFDYERYRNDTDNDQKPFFKQFLGMQMFTRFLERKLWASKNEDVIDVYLFDEHIRMKNLRIQRKIYQSVSYIEIIIFNRNLNLISLTIRAKVSIQHSIVTHWSLLRSQSMKNRSLNFTKINICLPLITSPQYPRKSPKCPKLMCTMCSPIA
jgi:hypothetical protein